MKRGGRLFQFCELWAFHQELPPRDVSFSFTSSSTFGKPFLRFSWRLEIGVRGETKKAKRKNVVFFKHFIHHKYTLRNKFRQRWECLQLVINIFLAEHWKYRVLLNFPPRFSFHFSSIAFDSRRKDWLMFLRIFKQTEKTFVSYFIWTTLKWILSRKHHQFSMSQLCSTKLIHAWSKSTELCDDISPSEYSSSSLNWSYFHSNWTTS